MKLKKFISSKIRITIFALILTLIVIPSSTNALAKTIYATSGFDVSTHSKEELYQDIYNTLLDPYIQNAIDAFYKKPVSYDLFGIKTLQITRPQGYRTFTFIIKIQLLPFVGAHNSIGMDNITFEISPGEVKLIKFEHIKDFPIPPYLHRIHL